MATATIIEHSKGKGRYAPACEMCGATPRYFCGRSRKFVFATGRAIVIAGWCQQHSMAMAENNPSEREVEDIRARCLAERVKTPEDV